MKKQLFLILCLCANIGFAVVAPAHGVADSKNTNTGSVENASTDSSLDVWGKGVKSNFAWFGNIQDPNLCIGASANEEGKCVDVWDSPYKPHLTADAEDEGVILMTIAHTIADEGAYFCPTQVEAHNKDSTRSTWTEYKNLAVNANVGDCFWVCRDGYTGKDCKTKLDNKHTKCESVKRDTKILSVETFANYTSIRNAPNIESSIPMFVRAEQHGRDEADVVLAVARWEPNGHGAFVRAFTINTSRGDDDWEESAPAVRRAESSTEQLVCLNGYKPDDAKETCIEIPQDEIACMENGDKFQYLTANEQALLEENPDAYNIVVTGANRVYLACNEKSGYAHPDSNSQKCELCERSTTKVIVNGVCVTQELPSGKGLDNEGNIVNYRTLVKTDLLYGIDNYTKQEAIITKQCWTKVGSEYKKCVLNQK